MKSVFFWFYNRLFCHWAHEIKKEKNSTDVIFHCLFNLNDLSISSEVTQCCAKAYVMIYVYNVIVVRV